MLENGEKKKIEEINYTRKRNPSKEITNLLIVQQIYIHGFREGNSLREYPFNDKLIKKK